MFKDDCINTELKSIISKLHISESTITFRKKKYDITPETAIPSLVNILYSECYALKEKYQTGSLLDRAFPVDLDPAFVTNLSENNQSSNTIDNGWEIIKNHLNGWLDISKNNTTKTIHYTQLANQSKGLDANTFVDLLQPKEDIHRQKTFYYAFSNMAFDMNQQMIRIYWNINSDGAGLLTHEITKKFNHYNIPFIFKCLNHPDLYFRRDAAVLYISDENRSIVNFLLPQLWNCMQSYLESDVPLFSFKYKNGIGIAENPNQHESFGMNRMKIVAESLVKNNTNALDTDELIQHITIDFLKKGIKLESPHLNKGTKTMYY